MTASAILAASRGERDLDGPGRSGACPAARSARQGRVLGQQVPHPGLVQTGAQRPLQGRGDAGQRVAAPVGEPGLVGRQVDVEAVEDPQPFEQLVGAGVEPVDLFASGPAGVGDARRRRACRSWPRPGTGRRPGASPAPARTPPATSAGRATARASWAIEPGWSITNPGVPCSAARSSNASRAAWSLTTLRANSRSPSSSRTSAKCSSLPTSSPTHTSTSSGVANPCLLPRRPVTCSGRPSMVRSPSSTLRTSDRAACPHQRFTHRPRRRQHPPGHHCCRGQ